MYDRHEVAEVTKVDLVTGFLGAGKTTFLLDYAKELVRRNERIGIIENDYGAINVDLLLLHEELKDKCRMEMVIGGDPDCHRRRLKTKLIAMGIDRYDRVLVEPSGVFDVDEFLDLLYEEPLDHLLCPGNVITVVDAEALLVQAELSGEIGEGAEESAKEGAVGAAGESTDGAVGESAVGNVGKGSGGTAGESTDGTAGEYADGGTGEITGDTEDSLRKNSADTRYLLAEELTKAGCVIYSKAERMTDADLERVTEYLNACLTEAGCSRRLTVEEILRKPEGGLSTADYDRLLSAGSRDYSYVKRTVLTEGAFRSVFFFHAELPPGSPEELLQRIFADPGCGRLARIKGFVPVKEETAPEDGSGTQGETPVRWLEINATREKASVRPCTVGQPVIIAIGENPDAGRIGSYLASYENEYKE